MGLLINVSRGKTSPEKAFKAIIEEFNGEKEKGSKKAYQKGGYDLLREIMEEMPKKKNTSVVAQAELVQRPEWNKKYNLMELRYLVKGFNTCHDQVNTILERKLSTVKKI